MNMSKFERRKQELERKFEEEMKALQEAEKKEIERRMEPVVSKLAKLIEEEARKALEASPEILETYSFKKREAGKEIKDALDRIFSATDEEKSDEAEAADAAPKSEPAKEDPPQETVKEETSQEAPTQSDDPFESDFAASSVENQPAPSAPDAVEEKSQEERRGFAPFRR